MKNNLLAYVYIPLIRTYQWCISPWFAASCRFQPTCSNYAEQALHTHGPLKGGLLTIKRLCRCQPFGRSGFDPVPPKGTPIHSLWQKSAKKWKPRKSKCTFSTCFFEAAPFQADLKPK